MIPFIDLATQQKRIFKGLQKRIFDVLAHGQYIMGPEVGELEKKLASYVGVKHAIACSNGTDALLMPLMAHGIGPGDAVFTSVFTFIATAEVISLLGAVPVFVDIDPDTFNLDTEKLKLAVCALKSGDPGIHPLPQISVSSLLPKGVIAVDLFGLPADYDRITPFAAQHGLFVIEDAAQSFGAGYHGKRAGSLGDAAATSFFPAKPLGCYGDGGAVFTDDDRLADSIRSIRSHGQGEAPYTHTRIGVNGRMDTIQAAVLMEKLTIFAEELEARNRIAEKYCAGLGHILKIPRVPPGAISSWAQYSVVSDSREAIRDALRQAGIPSAVYYPRPLHLQEAFSGLGYRRGDFPVSEEISRKIFSLPMHPYLEDELIGRIISIVESEGLT